MDFTREPIIETIITPKEGHKLVVRSSTSTSQEEYLVDAVEIVAFGKAQFFRSLERPKAFLVPISDYEILEVREARMVLKNASADRSIKIGGGRESPPKAPREIEKEVAGEPEKETEEAAEGAEGAPEGKLDKKRDRRRHYRKRKGRDETEEGAETAIPPLEDEKVAIQPPSQGDEAVREPTSTLSPAVLSSLLQPPPTLISETINRYRQDEMFKGAFFMTEEDQYKPHDKVQDLLNEDDEDEEAPRLQQPEFPAEETPSEINPEGHETTEFSYASEEESILKSRMPLLPQDQDTSELPPESPFEPSEQSADEKNPKPV